MKSLVNYTDSKDQGERVRAICSIGELGPRASEALPKLTELLKDENPKVRIEAQKSIDSINGLATTKPVPVSEFSAGKSEAIAVTEISAEGVSQSDATIVADWLRGALVSAGAYTVVERSAMQKVLTEQAFQQTGCTSQECAVKLGKVLNVQKIVVGSFGKFLDSYVLNVRMVDVESGKIVYSDTAKGKTTDEVEQNISSLAGRLSGNAGSVKQVQPVRQVQPVTPIRQVQPVQQGGW